MGSSISAFECRCDPLQQHGCDDEEGTDVAVDVTEHTAVNVGILPGVELLDAAANSDTNRIRELLRQSADIESRDKQGRSALHLAVLSSSLGVVGLLLECGIDKEAKDARGRTPLLAAAEKQLLDIAELLRDSGAKTDLLGKRLVDIAAKGDVALARSLIECRASMETRNKEGRTALHKAAECGQYDLVKLLLNKGVEKDAKTKDGRSALYQAAKYDHLSIVKLLVDSGARFRTADRELLGKKLISAVDQCDEDSIKILLMYDASTNVKGKDGKSPLVIATEKGHVEIANQIIQKGVPKEDLAAIGQILTDVCAKGDWERAKTCLKIGVDVNVGDCFGETPLWKAAIRGQLEIAKLLLDKKADLERCSFNCNRTPIVIAIDRGHIATAELLRAKGARLPEQGVLDRKLRDAAGLGELERARALIHFGASTKAVGSDKEACLHKAVAKGRLDVVRLLLENGADIDAKANQNRTPLHYAASNEMVEVTQFLLDNGANKNGRDKEGFKKAQALLRR